MELFVPLFKIKAMELFVPLYKITVMELFVPLYKITVMELCVPFYIKLNVFETACICSFNSWVGLFNKHQDTLAEF
jgi:hypothetical protein